MNKIIVLLFIFISCFTMQSCVEYKTIDQRISEEVNEKRNISYNIAYKGLSQISIVPKLEKTWKNLVSSEIKDLLKDPGSATFKFYEDPIYCSYANTSNFGILKTQESPIIGYAGLVFVNAKNSYGGYTGDKPWFFIISGKKILLIDNNNYGLWKNTNDVKNHLYTSYADVLLFINEKNDISNAGNNINNKRCEADLLFDKGKYADAALLYEKIIESDNDSNKSNAYFRQALSFKHLGQDAAAKARLQELIVKYPKSAEANSAKNLLNTL